MAGIQIENNTFYRKKVIDGGGMIQSSPKFSDVAYGQTNLTISLKGGTNINTWFVSGQVADTPRYGSSTLKGGNLILYGEDVDLTETAGVPNVKLYKMKEEYNYTEGGMSAGDGESGAGTANKLAVFTAFCSPDQYTYEENFDGSEKTLGDVVVLGNEGSTTLVQTGPYVSTANFGALLEAQANGLGLKAAIYGAPLTGDPDRTNLKLLKIFFASDLEGTKGPVYHTEAVAGYWFGASFGDHSKVWVPPEPANTLDYSPVVLLEPVSESDRYGLWKPKQDFRGTSDDESGVRVIVPYFYYKDIKNIIQYKNVEAGSDTEEAAEPTANTTIFDEGLIYTTPDISTFYGSGDDTGLPVTRSTLGLSSEKFHEGGQSLHMYHLWQFSDKNMSDDGVGTYFGVKDTFSNQYACVGTKKIPFPQPIDHAFSAVDTGDSTLTARSDFRMNLPEIEISFYIDEMDTVPRVGSYESDAKVGVFDDWQGDGSAEACIKERDMDTAHWSGSEGNINNTAKTLGRNFTITFANYPPEEGEGLDSYIIRGMDDFYSGAFTDEDGESNQYNFGSKYIGGLTMYRDIAIDQTTVEQNATNVIAQPLQTRMSPVAGTGAAVGSTPFPMGWATDRILEFKQADGADNEANMITFSAKAKIGQTGSGFEPCAVLSMDKWITAKFVIDVLGVNAQDNGEGNTADTAESMCGMMKVYFTEGYVSGSEGAGEADPFAFHPDVPSLDIYFPIKRSDGKSGVADGSSITWFDNRKYFPNIMCLWATNYRNYSATSGSSTYNEVQPWSTYTVSGAIEKADFGLLHEIPADLGADKQTSVFIDSIKLNNFTNSVYNASAQAGSSSQSIPIKEYGVKSPLQPSEGYQAVGTGLPSWNVTRMQSKLTDYYSPTYLLLGFENGVDDLEDQTGVGEDVYAGYLMFSGFGTQGFKKMTPQTDPTTQAFFSNKYRTSTLENKNYFGYWLQNFSQLSGNSNAYFVNDTTGFFSATQPRTLGNGLEAQKMDETAFTSEVTAPNTVGGFSFVTGSATKLYNDGMTQKGFGHLFFNPTGTMPAVSGAITDATGWLKCEHPFVAAKITKIPVFNETGGAGNFTVTDGRTFEVDNPSIFHLDEDTQYLIYVAGAKSTTSVRDDTSTLFEHDDYLAAELSDPQWAGGGVTGSIKVQEITGTGTTEISIQPGYVTGNTAIFDLCPNLWISMTGSDGTSKEIMRVITPFAHPSDIATPTGVDDILTVERGVAGTDATSYTANTTGTDPANAGYPIKQFTAGKGLTKVKKVEGNTVTIDTPLNPLLTPENLPYLYVSPYKYWMWLQLWPGGNNLPFKEAGGSSAKSYVSILPCASGSDAVADIGSTYNEESYTFITGNIATPGKTAAYAQTWDLLLGTGSAIDLSQDYGYGGYNEAENTGGYMDVRPAYNSQICALDISGANQKLEPAQKIVTKLSLDMPLSPQTISFYGNDYVDADSIYAADVKPYYLWSYSSPVGNLSNFKVEPTVDLLEPSFDLYTITDEDLASVTFDWQENVDYNWYRMLIVDVSGATISNKYHNAVLHLPLNEVPTSPTSEPANKVYNYTSPTGILTGSADTGDRCRADIQGANGYSLRPKTGVASPTGYLQVTGGATDSATPNHNPGFAGLTEFTFVVHFTADTGPGTRVIDVFSQGTATNSASLTIVETSGLVVFTFVNSAATSYSLTSKSAVPFDGESPMCVIITYKASSQSGPDMQMFIDGVREDYLQTVTGSITDASYDDIRVGIDGAGTPTTANTFNGTIEEVILYDKQYYVPQDSGKYILNTADFVDAASGKKLTHNSRLFVYDYHNIRGSSKNRVAFTDEVNWGATSL